ncbi:hypothetical protein [Dickeya dianthicola]|nr:hypothetical protein [Dickeya dianthicola]
MLSRIKQAALTLLFSGALGVSALAHAAGDPEQLRIGFQKGVGE